MTRIDEIKLDQVERRENPPDRVQRGLGKCASSGVMRVIEEQPGRILTHDIPPLEVWKDENRGNRQRKTRSKWQDMRNHLIELLKDR